MGCSERIIAEYTNNQPGPLLLVLGGIHGNESAGVKAIQYVGKMLEVEPITNPDFTYKGIFVGVLGNKKAFQLGQRYIFRDLNRSFTPENINFVRMMPYDILEDELQELKELLETVHSLIFRHQPEMLVVLDLHTTSGGGGIFSICSDDPQSLKIAGELGVPVVTGLLNGVKGSTLSYFNHKNTGVNTVSIAFESGQHDDPLSVNRAIAFVINCMKIIGSVHENHVENIHNKILLEYSSSLPQYSSIITKYSIKTKGRFRMIPGFSSFQPIKKGQLLAYDGEEAVYAPCDGRILMPLYQSKGEDGFFVVKEENY